MSNYCGQINFQNERAIIIIISFRIGRFDHHLKLRILGKLFS